MTNLDTNTKKDSSQNISSETSSKKETNSEFSKKLYRQLPFVKRKGDFGYWIDRNKYGVITLVITFIALFFAFVSIRIELTTFNLTQGELIEFVDTPEEQKEEEKQTPAEREMEIMQQQYYEDVKNRAANRSVELDEGMKDDRGTDADKLYEEAKRVQQQLEASRAAYEQGIAENEALRNKKAEPKKGETDKEATQSNIKGSVTVSFELDGRHASYLPVPSYKCQEGGEVEIEIEVNRNGEVTKATILRSTSKGNSCLNDTALSFAKQSQFQVGTSWPAKHKGTISYIFLQQ